MDTHKIPPQSNEAEISVLGGILIENESILKVLDTISSKDFYKEGHKKIFDCMVELSLGREPIDIVTLTDLLKKKGVLDEVGGIVYIAYLVDSVPSAANISHYAKIVKEKAVARQLISLAADIQEKAYSYDEIEEILGHAQKEVMALSVREQRSQLHNLRDVMCTVFNNTERMAANPSHVAGLPTGLAQVDRMIHGLKPGDLVIVAGRPGMGKAQPLDSKIRTITGWKPMGDITVGEELASIDEQRSFVNGIYPQGEKQIFRITFSDGRATECCEDHLWKVYYRSWECPRVLTTGRIRTMLTRKRYQRRLWIDSPTGDFGHSEKLPLDPWVLGALLGNGHLKNVSFSTASIETLGRLQEGIGQGYTTTPSGKYDHRIVRRGGCYVKGSNRVLPNGIKEALKGLGLLTTLSHDKFIPDIYMNSSYSVRLNVLRGLLDTDGWVEKWGSIRFSSSSEKLAKDVVELVRSIGGWCSIKSKSPKYTYKGEKLIGRTSFTCNIHHNNPQALLLEKYKLDRVKDKPLKGFRPTFISIEPSRTAIAQCISVSHPSSLYLTDDYIATHNTAWGMQIVDNVASDGKVVLVCSLEMTKEELATRQLASRARVDSVRIKTGHLSESCWPKLTRAAGEFSEQTVIINDSGRQSEIDIYNSAMKVKAEHGRLDLILVDYIGLCQASIKTENRHTALGHISRALKATAKDLGVPVIALSQLNRGLESRSDKRPMMSDLRESGNIEEDADLIMFIYRDEIYNTSPDNPNKGKAEIIIAKQRGGPVGTIEVAWEGKFTQFSDLPSQYEESNRYGRDYEGN